MHPHEIESADNCIRHLRSAEAALTGIHMTDEYCQQIKQLLEFLLKTVEVLRMRND